MSKVAKRTIKLEEITVAFFVRKGLVEGRVSQLIKLMEGKVNLPPIDVWWNEKTEKYEVIDGRHRLEAHKRMEYDGIDCRVIDEPDFANRVSMAVSANSFGSMAPTDEDYEVAIQGMLDAGVSVRRMVEVFPLPKSYTVKLIHNIKSKVFKATVNRAVDDIVNRGLSIPQAAEKHRVDTKSIKQKITGTKKVEKDAITDFTGGFTHRFRSFSQNNSADFKRLIDAYDIGRINEDAVLKIFKNTIRSGKNAVSIMEDWESRFVARVTGEKEHEERLAARTPVPAFKKAKVG